MKALARLRREGRGLMSKSGMTVFQVLGQVNEQLARAEDLDTFLKISVGLVKELTGFDRVMIYQFDSEWNGMQPAVP
jgi:light-regulated signal transduction histidine kinase (bacteriophytochrome)